MKNVLWIDDDARMLDSCCPIFEENGFYLFKATNTSRALTLLRQHGERLHGVLLDVRLSHGENGLELLGELRHRYPGLTVVVFTAYPNYKDHVSAQASGALTYFHKIDKSIPLDPERQREFFSALHSLFPATAVHPGPGARPSPPTHAVPLWAPALVILLVFFAAITGIAVLWHFVPAWIFPLAIAFTVFVFVVLVLSVMRLRGDDTISEKGFLAGVSQVLDRTAEVIKFWSRSRKDTADERETEQVAPADPEQ